MYFRITNNQVSSSFADGEKSQNALLHELARPTGVEITEDGELVPGSEDLHFMNLLTIRAATDDFSDSNKLGKGGFGTVYKVTKEGSYLAKLFTAFTIPPTFVVSYKVNSICVWIITVDSTKNLVI